jgi:hypothetical protein
MLRGSRGETSIIFTEEEKTCVAPRVIPRFAICINVVIVRGPLVDDRTLEFGYDGPPSPSIFDVTCQRSTASEGRRTVVCNRKTSCVGKLADVRSDIGIVKVSFLVSQKFCVTLSRIPRFEKTWATIYGGQTRDMATRYGQPPTSAAHVSRETFGRREHCRRASSNLGAVSDLMVLADQTKTAWPSCGQRPRAQKRKSLDSWRP